MKVLKVVGIVLGGMIVFVLGISTECYIRGLSRKPIPVLCKGVARVEVAAHVQPDVFWSGEAWWIEIKSDVPVAIDLDGKWHAVVPVGTNTIYSNHDVNNTMKFSSNRWWQTPSKITVREASPQQGTGGNARATPEVPNKRDGQVLDALLLHLLSDPKFDMTRVSTNGATIVLHTQTPEKTGFLQSHQMGSDVGGHTLPSDAESDLQKRNSPPNSKPDTYDAVATSFTDLTFSAGIVVADLTATWKDHRSFHAFEDAYPKARGYVKAYLPGYSKDGTRALVRAAVGPSPHGAMMTAALEKSGDKWVVKWHHIARYV